MQPLWRRQGLRRQRLRRPLWRLQGLRGRPPLRRRRRLRRGGLRPLQLQLLPVVGILPALLSKFRLR